MPIYEYECRECGKSVDIRHGFKEKIEQKCAECGGELARRFHAAGIVFKGSGFYVTDSRKSSGGGDTKKSAGSSDTKSDAKPSESKSSDAASTTSPSESKPDAPKGKGDAAA